jgi:hypothetical protein
VRCGAASCVPLHRASSATVFPVARHHPPDLRCQRLPARKPSGPRTSDGSTPHLRGLHGRSDDHRQQSLRSWPSSGRCRCRLRTLADGFMPRHLCSDHIAPLSVARFRLGEWQPAVRERTSEGFLSFTRRGLLQGARPQAGAVRRRVPRPAFGNDRTTECCPCTWRPRGSEVDGHDTLEADVENI